MNVKDQIEYNNPEIRHNLKHDIVQRAEQSTGDFLFGYSMLVDFEENIFHDDKQGIRVSKYYVMLEMEVRINKSLKKCKKRRKK